VDEKAVSTIDAVGPVGHYRAMGGIRVGVPVLIWAMVSFGCGSVRHGDMDGGASAADAAPDLQPDAARGPLGDGGELPGDAAPEADASGGSVLFDVGYVDDFTLTSDINRMFSFLVIVNMGTSPIDLSTVSVVSYTDDSPIIEWTFVQEESTTIMLEPGRAAGRLSPLAATMVLTDDVVTEPIDDMGLNFAMEFGAPLSLGQSLRAETVVRVQGATVALPIAVNASDAVEFNSARRVSAGILGR
jgi:hypothetical protein